MVAKTGLFAWFKSSELGTSGNGGSKWVSTVGKFIAKPTKGTVKTVTTTGNGAKGQVRAVTGTTASSYNFGGNILADKYTICSLTRYTGGARNRILTGTRSNWLHGHWANRAGVAHYDGWLGGAPTDRVGNKDDWVVLCGTSQKIILHGKVVASRGNHVAGSQGVAINTGENSDWAVAEIITWNRVLSDKEMQDATVYLQKVLDGGSHAHVFVF